MTMQEIPQSAELSEHSGAMGTMVLLRGLLAIAFGLIAMSNPASTARALMIVFAVWAFVDAGFAFATAYHHGRSDRPWGWYVFEGLVGIAAGVVAIAYPGLTMFVLVIIIALRALFLGLLMLAGAIRWKGLPSRWLGVVTGIVSFVFGVLLLWRPLAGALALVWTIGIYAVVFGIVGVVLGIEILGERLMHPPRREAFGP